MNSDPAHTGLGEPTQFVDAPAQPALSGDSQAGFATGGGNTPGTLGLGSLGASIPVEDLSGDKLIHSARRTVYNEKPVPSLGGIPLLAKLGQGGMGAVYYGLHPRLNREVAVKILPFHPLNRTRTASSVSSARHSTPRASSRRTSWR
jgi:hypothetical protein